LISNAARDTNTASIVTLDYEALKATIRATGKARPVITAHACALYARKSTEGQNSEEMQVEEMRDYAHHSLRVPIYTDGGVEAVYQETKSGLITDRPKYQALKELIRSRKISHVLLWIPSRWGRNTVEFLTAFAELDALGVEVYSTTDGRMTWDKVDEEAYKAKAESITISKRVTPAMRRRVKNGEVMQKRPYGYLKAGPNGVVASKVTQLDPVAAPIVKELFRRYVAGESIYSLTQWFNAETGLKKRNFGVRRLLENPFYAGILTYGRQRASLVQNDNGAQPREKWVTSSHDCPIVPVSTWQAAQERLTQNQNQGQPRGKEPMYPLTGLLVCAGTPGKACADAPKRMHGQPDQTGKYPFYHCPYCGKSRSQKKIEKALNTLLATIPVGLDAIAAAVETTTPTADTGVAEMEQQIAKLQARRTRLMARWGDAETADDKQAVQEALDDTQRELNALRARVVDAARVQVADDTHTATLAWLKGIESWTTLLEGMTTAEANELYRSAFQRCVVDTAENTLTVEWLPWAARLTGTPEQTVPLLSKADGRRAKK